MDTNFSEKSKKKIEVHSARISARNWTMKLMAILMIAAVIVMVSFSVFYINAMANHRCCDDYCRVCDAIELATDFLNQVNEVLPALILPVLVILLIVYVMNFEMTYIMPSTLITQKIRIDS